MKNELPTYSHWDKIPDANFVTKDGDDGSCWWYEKFPIKSDYQWVTSGGSFDRIPDEYIGELADLPWEQSLIERPEETDKCQR